MLRRLIILIISGFLLFPAIAHAHTSLIASAPAEGEVLTALPNAIELTFDDSMMKIGKKDIGRILLRDPENRLVNLGEVLTSDKTVSAQIKGNSKGSGLYKIYFRVVSADGHPVSGQINFSIGKEDLSSKGNDISPVKESGSNLIFAGIVALIAGVLMLLIIRRRSGK